MTRIPNSSISGSDSDLLKSVPRPFAAQSAESTPLYHHSGFMQGMQNINGNFTMGGSVPTNDGQQPSGRYGSNNIPLALSQGYLPNRGGISFVGNPAFNGNMSGVAGSIPGIQTSTGFGNRGAAPGFVSPVSGNIIGGANIGQSTGSGGALAFPGLNLTANIVSGNFATQSPNRLMGGGLQQATPQVISSIRNSYPTAGGQLSQNQVQAGNNLSAVGMLNDTNSGGNSPFSVNDFPQLSGRPTSPGGPQGQLGPLRRSGGGVSSIVQRNQEFNFQNEDFPALPGCKGGSTDYARGLDQKEQYNDNAASMMQSQQFSMGMSAGGYSYTGSYPSHRTQQNAPSVSSSGVSFALTHGSNPYPSFNSQTSGLPSMGQRQLNSSNSVIGLGSSDSHSLYFQQTQPQFRLQQISAANQSYRENKMKPLQASSDRFGLLGLLGVSRASNPALNYGMDLTKLGLDLSSTDDLHKRFASPWSDKPAKGESEYSVPNCYNAREPPVLNQTLYSKIKLETLFYIFYSMPREEAQLYAANELHNRGWFYHKDNLLWYKKNGQPLVQTSKYERCSCDCFDPIHWKIDTKENFVLDYESLEKRPTLS